MNQETADYIVEAVKANNKMDAIRALRNHTHLGLIQAKNYVEAPDLAKRLTADYVMSITDELTKARQEFLRMAQHVADLEQLEGLEHEQRKEETVAMMGMTKADLAAAIDGLSILMSHELNNERYTVTYSLHDRLSARHRIMK